MTENKAVKDKFYLNKIYDLRQVEDDLDRAYHLGKALAELYESSAVAGGFLYDVFLAGLRKDKKSFVLLKKGVIKRYSS